MGLLCQKLFLKKILKQFLLHEKILSWIKIVIVVFFEIKKEKQKNIFSCDQNDDDEKKIKRHFLCMAQKKNLYEKIFCAQRRQRWLWLGKQ